MSAFGLFGWYELMTPDPAAAQAFYTKVIGWGVQPWEMPDMHYAMWTANGDPMGGCMELPREAREMGAPPHWLGYVYVPDAAVCVAKAVELGGQIFVPPTPIPTVGTFAVFADPQGATIAILQPEQPSDAPPPQGDGYMGWQELATTDVAGALAFYGALFGWRETMAMDMGGGMTYHLVGKGEAAFGGFFAKPPAMPGPSAWLYYVRVPSVAGVVAEAERLGGKLLMGPHEVPGGDVIAQLLDPQGAFFAVVGK